MRGWIQAAAALLQNAYLAFPWTRNLYQGPLKSACVPGLNCHACPAALFACPLGSLQHFVAGIRPAVRWGTYRLGFSVVGFLAAVGLLGGRFACGWLCPFGFFQELLHRIPSPKFGVPRRLWNVRYAVLAVLVVGLPAALVNRMGYGEVWFCRLACPAGTLEGAPLFALVPALRDQVGALYGLKLGVLVGVVAWAVVAYRPYCRTLCPLGAIYGWFNRWSLLQVRHDPSRCRDCGNCLAVCRAELDPRTEARSTSCLRCVACARAACPNGALRITGLSVPAPGDAETPCPATPPGRPPAGTAGRTPRPPGRR